MQLWHSQRLRKIWVDVVHQLQESIAFLTKPDLLWTAS
jgi:hypothetical protein